jgi:hypothetical protein
MKGICEMRLTKIALLAILITILFSGTKPITSQTESPTPTTTPSYTRIPPLKKVLDIFGLQYIGDNLFDYDFMTIYDDLMSASAALNLRVRQPYGEYYEFTLTSDADPTVPVYGDINRFKSNIGGKIEVPGRYRPFELYIGVGRIESYQEFPQEVWAEIDPARLFVEFGNPDKVDVVIWMSPSGYTGHIKSYWSAYGLSISYHIETIPANLVTAHGIPLCLSNQMILGAVFAIYSIPVDFEERERAYALYGNPNGVYFIERKWLSPYTFRNVNNIADFSNKVINRECLIGRSDFWFPDPPDTPAIYRPSTSTFHFPTLPSVTFGNPNDHPITGDWNGDGIDTLGVFDPLQGRFQLRNSNTPGAPDLSFLYGNPGDIPLAGHWTATATHDGVGTYRNTNGTMYLFLRNQLSTGYADLTAIVGNPGDLPIVGDWNGDGVDTVGLYRPDSTTFYLFNRNAPDMQPEVIFTLSGGVPIAGRWTGSGGAGVGFFADGVFSLKDTPASGAFDRTVNFGETGDLPLAGRWSP